MSFIPDAFLHIFMVQFLMVSMETKLAKYGYDAFYTYTAILPSLTDA